MTKVFFTDACLSTSPVNSVIFLLCGLTLTCGQRNGAEKFWLVLPSVAKLLPVIDN